MKVDADTVWSRVGELRDGQRSVSEGMAWVIDACAASFPHADWARMREISWGQDAGALTNWLASTFAKEPPPESIHGLWFGLFNPSDDDGTTADLRFHGAASYDASDEDLIWLNDDCYSPSDPRAHAGPLREMYRLAYGSENGLGNEAEWSLGLAYAVLAVRTACSGLTSTDIPGDAETVGVAVGFESGDLLMLGELREDGFHPAEAAP